MIIARWRKLLHPTIRTSLQLPTASIPRPPSGPVPGAQRIGNQLGHLRFRVTSH